MRIRAAADDDLPAIAAIAAANDDEGAGSAADPRYVARLRSDGRFLVADDGGTVAGYCGARPAGRAVMLCDLFVHPDRQGAGVGGLLLRETLPAAGERFTYASKDPRAMPLYVRHGMIPYWPLLYLRGPWPARGIAPSAAGLELELVTPVRAAAAEREITGQDRAADYAYWATADGSTGLIVRQAGRVAAAAAAAPGHLMHLACARQAGPDAVQAGPDAVLAVALEAAGPGPVRLCLPGPHPAVPRLLAAGFRIFDYDHYMASRPGLVSTGDAPSSALG